MQYLVGQREVAARNQAGELTGGEVGKAKEGEAGTSISLSAAGGGISYPPSYPTRLWSRSASLGC